MKLEGVSWVARLMAGPADHDGGRAGPLEAA